MIVQIVTAIEECLQSINFLNFEIDKWILVLYLHLCVPLGFLFQKIQSSQLRLWYNLILGLFFAMVMSKEWFLYLNLWSISIYIVSKLFKKCVLPVTILAFAIMSYVHVYRLIYDYLSWKMDYNTLQMMLTCRYIYYAVDIQDHKVKNTFFTYYSYIFMFPNLIIAPVPYKNFMNLIHKIEDFSKFRYRYAYISLFKALLFSAGEVIIRPYFDLDWYWTAEWAQMNILERNLLNLVIASCARFQYFAAFKYAQAAMDAMGITYNPETCKKDKKLLILEQCDRFSVADYHYEIEKNAVKKTQMWNSNVQMWLKYCFYDRLNKQFGASTFYIIFLVSCVWHGFYLSYYLFFFFWALTSQLCKYFYKAQRKFYWIPEGIRHFIAFLFIQITMNNTALSMRILDWDRGIQFQNSMYWWPQICVVLMFIFFFITQYGQSNKIKK